MPPGRHPRCGAPLKLPNARPHNRRRTGQHEQVQLFERDPAGPRREADQRQRGHQQAGGARPPSQRQCGCRQPCHDGPAGRQGVMGSQGKPQCSANQGQAQDRQIGRIQQPRRRPARRGGQRGCGVGRRHCRIIGGGHPQRLLENTQRRRSSATTLSDCQRPSAERAGAQIALTSSPGASLRMRSSPPCACATSRHSAKPRPVPPAERVRATSGR